MGATRGEHEQLFNGPLTDGLPSIIGAAHELKSPLVLMRQLSLMLQDQDISFDERTRMLNQISLTAEKALRLTSDLTRSIRLSDALFTLEPINPQQLCQDVVQELTPLFNAHNRNIKFISRKHPLLMIANRDLLRRIVMNFSDNALHYADNEETVEIRIKSYKSGKAIRLCVRDYGPAISSSLFKTLKGKLLYSSEPIHSRPLSSGLGVYIASQFAEIMNGKIGITRHRDGSTFYIELQASSQLSLL